LSQTGDRRLRIVERVFDDAALVRDAFSGQVARSRRDRADGAPPRPGPDVVCELDAAHREVSGAQRRMLALIAEADRRESWRDTGAHGLAHWLSMRYGISWWKASRWVHAAHALDHLPAIAEALACGRLSLDAVVELTRFAMPDDEAGLVEWAETVSPGAIRDRADLWAKQDRDDVVDAQESRTLSWWWFDEGRRFALEAELPGAQGAVVANAIQAMARRTPVMPGEEAWSMGARRADALLALCSAGGPEDSDARGVHVTPRTHVAPRTTRQLEDARHPEDARRPTVVVHARLEGLLNGAGGAELEGVPAIPVDAARRLLCDARIQTVVEDRSGNAIGVGRTRREPAPWMVRQIRYRDRECRFPACGARRFTEAHHIRWWRHGGRTDLDNLVLICSFHHRLVHEYGWSIRRNPDRTVDWFDRTGVRYRAGPAPPVTS
jgi:hypothetical protein